MKDYNFFNTYINDKDILYIPIISCINRDTNEYNLSADGNVNRFITTFSKCNLFKNLYIVLPSVHEEGTDYIVKNFESDSNGRVHIIWAKNFGIHAGEQRNDDKVVKDIYDDIKTIKFDICIFESQKLGLTIMSNHEEDTVTKYIWWNPVSKTNKKTRVFLEGYDDINKEVISKVNYMIIASPDQVEYYNYINDKLIYLDILIDRNLYYFDYEPDYNLVTALLNRYQNKKIFFLPFRLTDEGYKLDKVLEYISKTSEDYVILYTDPNNSHLVQSLKNKDKFARVPSNRRIYYTILDNIRCTIPYFEDLEFINHAAIHEFMHPKVLAEVVVYNQRNNPYNIFSCPRIKHYEE